jgi:hypothetical protein
MGGLYLMNQRVSKFKTFKRQMFFGIDHDSYYMGTSEEWITQVIHMVRENSYMSD